MPDRFSNLPEPESPSAASTHRSTCPIACTLDLVGDRWTLLIIRDMMFFGKQRFEEFLSSPERISTNILTNRLKLLEELGLVAKQPYGSHSRRMSYVLTERGQSLRPVLKTVAVWGLRQIPATEALAPEKRAQMFNQKSPGSTSAESHARSPLED